MTKDAGNAQVRIIETDGSERTIEAPRDGMFAALYPELRCTMLELVTLNDGREMLCDEEGRLRGRELNWKASQLAERYIVGAVAVLDAGDLL